MSKADKMFEELGFSKTENEFLIRYVCSEPDESSSKCIVIEFFKTLNSFRCFQEDDYNFDDYACVINTELNEVLQLKLIELGWVE